MSEWKPIGTAPTSIPASMLLWPSNHGNVFHGYRNDGSGSWSRIGDFEYNPQEPTHWMPLPEPPSTDAKSPAMATGGVVAGPSPKEDSIPVDLGGGSHSQLNEVGPPDVGGNSRPAHSSEPAGMTGPNAADSQSPSAKQQTCECHIYEHCRICDPDAFVQKRQRPKKTKP